VVKSALEGRSVREVATELFSGYVGIGPPSLASVSRHVSVLPPPDDEMAAWLKRWEELGRELAERANGGYVALLDTDRAGEHRR
jgi:hypothetical protein